MKTATQIQTSPYLVATPQGDTFSGKERDSETGYSYLPSLRSVSSLRLGQVRTSSPSPRSLRQFGARYYSSDLSIRLSVDPMSDKYPSMSPYVYCANNPMRLVDPDGREVEYNSFVDRIIVGLEGIFNSYFNKTFRELKKSDETYVFRKHSYNAESNFTCEGNPHDAKLYVNYGMGKGQKRAKETIFSQLCHESEHARQFEHGELGFRCEQVEITDTQTGNTNSIYHWDPLAYDLRDEIKAHDESRMGFRWRTTEYSKLTTDIKKAKSLRSVDTYSKLVDYPCNIQNTFKRKDSYAYYLPHK